MCPSSNQTPSEVCSETKRLEISPSLHSPGKLHKGGNSSKPAGESASGFKGAPNSKKGKRR